MPEYYSQQGEDCVIASIFKGKTDGFYVDVGAHDGIRFSNTYHFDLMGWNGVCCEPHPRFFELLKKNRPRAICLDKAVSNYQGRTTFYANSRGALSTLDKNLESSFKSYGEWFTGFEETEVEVDTLNNLLEGRCSEVDIASIDVEGTELSVLQGFNLGRWKPKVLVIETNKQEDVDKFMEEAGYIMVRRIPPNTIYLHPSAAGQIDTIRMAKGPGKLIHTEGCNLYINDKNSRR